MLAVAAVPLTAVATAWACTSLATLQFGERSVQPGQQVTVTGENFQAFGKAGPVELHFGGLVGEVVATEQPDELGRIRATFTVPEDVAFGGQYVIVGTQETKKGEPAFGTPARAPIVVAGPNGTTAPADVGAAPEEPAPLAAEEQATSTATWIVLGALGALALALLGGGLGLFLREVRSPATASARQE